MIKRPSRTKSTRSPSLQSLIIPEQNKTKVKKMTVKTAVIAVLLLNFTRFKLGSTCVNAVFQMKSTHKSPMKMSTWKFETRCKISCAYAWNSYTILGGSNAVQRHNIRFIQAVLERRLNHQSLFIWQIIRTCLVASIRRRIHPCKSRILS